MEISFNKQSFKKQAKAQFNTFKQRKIDCKLSDVQESLAVAYGFKNLATLYKTFSNEDFSYVDSTEFKKQTSNLFVITWAPPTDDEDNLEEVISIYPPGTQISDVAGWDWEAVVELNTRVLAIPKGIIFSEETIVLENFATVPRIAKYGLGGYQDEHRVDAAVIEHLGFRVPKTGVEVKLFETGDDCSSKDHLLVWLNDADTVIVNQMFNKN